MTQYSMPIPVPGFRVSCHYYCQVQSEMKGAARTTALAGSVTNLIFSTISQASVEDLIEPIMHALRDTRITRPCGREYLEPSCPLTYIRDTMRCAFQKSPA